MTATPMVLRVKNNEVHYMNYEGRLKIIVSSFFDKLQLDEKHDKHMYERSQHMQLLQENAKSN